MGKCAFDIGGARCAALTRMACAKCSFRQTEEELRAGRKKADERISTLDSAQRLHIYDLYHNYENKKKWEVAKDDKGRKHKTACAH